MGRTGKTHLSNEAGPPVVGASPFRQQRPLHLLPNRDRLPTQRQLKLRLRLCLRLRGNIERVTGSTGFWVNGKST
jgi:hypothetical protein